MAAARVVSLVPSLTEAVTALGCGDRLAGVTRYCTVGAPASAARVGGTKNPSVDAVLALAPDLVLANVEENRREDVEALRAAGVTVHCSFPRGVGDVGPLLCEVADLLGVPEAAGPLARDVDQALARAARRRPDVPVTCLVPIWRKPWMVAGSGTFVDDLLARCGFANVARAPRYPRADTPPAAADVVLLPSEPYAFGPGDVPALRAWAGGVGGTGPPRGPGGVGGTGPPRGPGGVGGTGPPRGPGDVAYRFVDGRLLTWHGPSTAQALDVFTDLAAELAGRGPTSRQ